MLQSDNHHIIPDMPAVRSFSIVSTSRDWGPRVPIILVTDEKACCDGDHTLWIRIVNKILQKHKISREPMATFKIFNYISITYIHHFKHETQGWPCRGPWTDSRRTVQFILIHLMIEISGSILLMEGHLPVLVR